MARVVPLAARTRGVRIIGIDRADKARGSVYRIEPTELGEHGAAQHIEAAPTCEAPPDRPERATRQRSRRAVGKRAGPARHRSRQRHRRLRAKCSTPRSRGFPASTWISFASTGETMWAGSLPPIFRDGCSCACSLTGSRPWHLGISIGRSCGVCASPGRKPSSSRDGRPFASRRPTTREGVGLKPGALLVRE